ncbi:MAG: hypothetical protein WCE62_18725 [Polyangiales bacterium]
MNELTDRPRSRYIEIDHCWISNDEMPLYRWTFPEEATDEELEACLRAREHWGARAHYHVAWVIDLSNIIKASATQRQAFARHLKRFEEYNIRWNTGSALVVPKAWLRGLVTAVFWLSPPEFPNKLFSEPLEAEGWAKAQLAAKLAALRADGTR